MSGEIHDFSQYLYLTDDMLLARLAQVTSELSNLHEEIAMIEAQEIREKGLALQTTDETTSSGRRDMLARTVVEGPATRVELTGQRDALAEERWFLIRLMEVRHASHA